MANAHEMGVFTLTPLHCGTGQAFGAVDLPIARESHTQIPLIPSTSLKGVLRDAAEHLQRTEKLSKSDVEKAFGKRPPGPADDEDITPGNLVFTDGHLLLFPVRSLTRPFFWVTCPLIIRRWARARRSLGLEVPPDLPKENTAVASFGSHTGPLVLDDVVVPLGSGRLGHSGLRTVLEQWVKLLPPDADERKEILEATVCTPDEVFADLVVRTTPVNARIQLTGGKTTGTWQDPDGQTERGNLWYEETLPSDCLLSTFITAREGSNDSLTTARATIDSKKYFQIGGNESVGYGLSWWRLNDNPR